MAGLDLSFPFQDLVRRVPVGLVYFYSGDKVEYEFWKSLWKELSRICYKPSSLMPIFNILLHNKTPSRKAPFCYKPHQAYSNPPHWIQEMGIIPHRPDRFWEHFSTDVQNQIEVLESTALHCGAAWGCERAVFKRWLNAFDVKCGRGWFSNSWCSMCSKS